MVGDFERFDMSRRPKSQWLWLTVVTWILSFPKKLRHLAKIKRFNVPKRMKPPYFLLCNHNSFMDFKIMSAAIFPYKANYVVAIDGFIHFERLMRALGCICHRKFSKNVSMVRNMLHVVRHNGNIMVLFPEARYSLSGTQATMPESLGKMVRIMNVPVVTLIMHGHHINSPSWNIGNRGVMHVESEMSLLLTKEETQELSIDEINARVAEAFQYDDYAWQKEKNIRCRKKRRAEGLHRVLYQCPACNTENKMTSEKSILSCGSCGKEWEMTELGELRALTGETEFSHIPSWYEWERANVRREVEDGVYSIEGSVRVASLPNSKGFVRFSEPGRFVHNMSGITLNGVYEGEPFEVSWPAATLNTCHVEFKYKKWGDCVELSTNDDTFYLFPERPGFAVTKVALATEELYRYYEGSQEVGEPVSQLSVEG